MTRYAVCDRDTCRHYRELHTHLHDRTYCGGRDCQCGRYVRRPLLLRALDRLNIRVTITNRRNPR